MWVKQCHRVINHTHVITVFRGRKNINIWVVYSCFTHISTERWNWNITEPRPPGPCHRRRPTWCERPLCCNSSCLQGDKHGMEIMGYCVTWRTDIQKTWAITPFVEGVGEFERFSWIFWMIWDGFRMVLGWRLVDFQLDRHYEAAPWPLRPCKDIAWRWPRGPSASSSGLADLSILNMLTI